MAAHPVELEDDDASIDDASGADAEPGARARVLRSFVVSALSVSPGPELVTALLALTGRGDLSAREWVEVAVGWKKVGCLARPVSSLRSVSWTGP